MNQFQTYYRRHLPHYQPEDASYHVVFRLAGSLPANVVEELRFQREQEEKRLSNLEIGRERDRLLHECRWKHFDQFEKSLGKSSAGPFWLRKPRVAEIVDEAIRYRDPKEYDLIASTIMPNHVHMVFTLLSKKGNDDLVCRTDCPTYTEQAYPKRAPYFEYRLSNVLRKLKWNTALRANRFLGRRGAFWQDESYDHVIRDSAELDRTIEYVLVNPVNAGLCNDWQEWKWSYIKQDVIGD